MSGNPFVVKVIQGVRVWSDDESDGVRVVVLDVHRQLRAIAAQSWRS